MYELLSVYLYMNFTNNGFMTYDDYMTPKYAWENIIDYIPHDKVIWEAFYGDGKSGSYLKDMGYNVIHEKIDFFNIIKIQII